MIADVTAQKLIEERARVAELFASPDHSGMRTLKMDGMEKVLRGLTDLKQVRSVCSKQVTSDKSVTYSGRAGAKCNVPDQICELPHEKSPNCRLAHYLHVNLSQRKDDVDF